MRFLKYLIIIIVTVLVTLGIVYGFSCVSCGGCEESSGEEAAVRTAVTLSVEDTEYDEYFTDEDEEYEGSPQWLVVTFDVVFIALTIGVIVLCWWLYKRFVRNLNRRNRRFG